MTSTRAQHTAFRAALLGGSALGAALIATAAFAQTSGAQPPNAAGTNTLEEIVVTAQKREQNLQSVPISMTAVSPQALVANRITNITDLGAVAPNLEVRETAGGVGIPVFSMRGVVSFGSVPGQDKSISSYLDGVYLGANQGSSFELPDLERIEVLRGPQGTLFGRNATGGAINIITRNPAGVFGVHQEVTYGNLNQIRSATRIESPQMGPLSASISYTHDQHKGDIKNLGAGQVWDRSGPRTNEGVQVSPETLGAKNADTWFVAVRFQPNDNFETVYKFDWSANHSTPEGTGLVAVNPEALGPAAGVLNAILASNPVIFSGPDRPKYVNNSWTTNSYERDFGHNVTTSIHINDHLSLKNILAYRENFIYANDQISGMGGVVVTPQVAAAFAQLAGIPVQFLQGLVGAPMAIADSQSQSFAKQFSDEVQLNYESKYLTVTTGGLFFNQNTVTGTPYGLPVTPILTPFPGGVIPVGPLNTSFNYNKSSAAYVQAEAHVTPKLDVVGGYRITKDEKTGTTYVSGVAFPLDYENTRPSYLLGVNYKPTDSILVYGKYATGFVSGGAVGPVAFEPETVKSWEGGVKSDLLDRRLRLNMALFTATYQNLQAVTAGFNIGRPDLGTLVINQGGLKTKGVEGEFTLLPITGLSINGGIGYTDSRFTSVNPIFGTVETFQPTLRPKWTGNIATQYETRPLFDDARAVFRLDASYHSREVLLTPTPTQPVPPQFEPLVNSPASWILNARVSLQHIQLPQGKGHMEVALWAKNLNDNGTAVFPINFSFLASTSYTQARTFGIDITYDY